jgi:ribosomal protein S18 acetylase RimI-like enzyme
MFFKKSFITKLVLSVVIFAGVGAGIFVYYRYPNFQFSQGPIYDFDEARDTAPILELFKTDRYWLLANPNSSPEAMLKYRTPYPHDPFYSGKLHIKVLREQGVFIGFVSYYKETFKDWRLLFIAVKSEMRGKHEGEKLMNYALEDMKKLGASRVLLTTRTENFRGQKLYKRLGFTEYERDDGYVQFEKKLK